VHAGRLAWAAAKHDNRWRRLCLCLLLLRLVLASLLCLSMLLHHVLVQHLLLLLLLRHHSGHECGRRGLGRAGGIACRVHGRDGGCNAMPWTT
jgi:hypothetical protein